MHTYEAPEALNLGPVEELTFGGNLYNLPIDSKTGWVGFRQQHPPVHEDKE